MILAILTFAAVFLLVATLGLLLFYRERVLGRIAEVVHPRRGRRSLRGALEQTGSSLGGMVGQFEHVLPKSQAEVSIARQRLQRAGYRSPADVSLFYGFKVVVPLGLAALALVSRVAEMSPFFVYAMALGLGFLLPDFWLSHSIKARQQRIRRALPDVLDLLVICIEAGQSMDQAVARTSTEMRNAYPDLCGELGLLLLEQRAGQGRTETWKNLAERTGEQSIRNLVSMVVQSEQFGTSIARTLRVHADSLRTQRVQMVEEQAAKTSVKLVFPLVLFIFPALFLVTLGPAVILMMESFNTLNNH
jgi:tight adherence protein C